MCKASTDMLCGLFGKTRQAYYQKQEYVYREAVSEGIILNKIAEIRRDMPRIGGRKLWKTINEEMPADIAIGRDALFDLLDRHGLKVSMRKRRARTTFSYSWMHRWPNLIRDVVPTAANQIWVSDITYIGKEKDFVYLHLVTDMYSKRIMGWCVSPTLHADYTLSALKMAIRNAGCRLDGLIHHSDRGCQYCCDRYVKELHDNNILISMTESGDPLENAVAERVNGILKMEWLNYESFLDVRDVRARVAEIVNIYNSKRKHLSLGYRTPDQAYGMHGEMDRRWKNYFRHDSGESDDMFEKLTRQIRTDENIYQTSV